MESLRDATVVITGASSGIGLATAQAIFGRMPMPWAAGYTASKAGLAGFSEALRFELSSHSEIEVCAVYPAYVDTPTYLNSANYTGRALRPRVEYGERPAGSQLSLRQANRCFFDSGLPAATRKSSTWPTKIRGCKNRRHGAALRQEVRG